ncbi:MAG: phytanoyl-CoA dioxygenase family protein [Pseudomonadota bacterium]
MKLIEEILPANYLLSAALAINLHAGETCQPAHTDDIAQNCLNLSKPHKPYGVSTMWSIDEFTNNNGATEVVPGSHTWTSDRVPRDEDYVKIEMPAGSVVVFLGTLLHRGGANHSKGSRLAITSQYCAPGLRQIENMALAIPQKIAAGYSNRIQSMLDYSVIEPGFVGYVDGRHPKKLIDADYHDRQRSSK